MLNPQWLRTFVTLAEVRNFTRTAEQLELTQAAISQHVSRLEERLGPLLIRRPRNLELTPAGQALLEYCADVGAADQRLQQRLTEADAEHGEISLISPGSIGLALYPHLLELQQATPGLTIRHRFARIAKCWQVCWRIVSNWGWYQSNLMTRGSLSIGLRLNLWT